MIRFIKVLFTFFFPLGIWMGLLGYETKSLFALILGWTAVLVVSERE